MNFKKTLISISLLISLISNANALNTEKLISTKINEEGIEKIDKLINNGILINKKLSTENPKIELFLFKALTENGTATALLRIKNLSNEYINVSDYVDYGKSIKQSLAPEELTYILIEDNEENAEKRIKQEKIYEKDIKRIVKKDFSKLKKYISTNVNVFNIIIDKENKADIKKIYIDDFINYIDNIELLDYFTYLKLNVQNSLYHGYYFTGYEINKQDKIKRRTYYFITDEISNKISTIYIINKHIEYKDLKKIILEME